MEKTVNSFSRSLDNVASNGFYPTREKESERLGRLFRLQGETCILEPCVGNGTAVTAFKRGLRREEGEKVFLYGVEINRPLFEEAAPKLDYIKHEDFLLGIEATRGFSLSFCNPPYMAMDGRYERYETAFLHRLFSFLTNGGYLVLIVPVQTCRTAQFCTEAVDAYEVCDIFRFDEDEYEKRHQLALILRRKDRRGHKKGEAAALMARFSVPGEIGLIPETEAPLYGVPASADAEIVNFRTISPDYGAMHQGLSGSLLTKRAILRAQSSSYRALTVGKSPTPATKDDLYRLLMAGFGHGIAGSRENGTVHLNRGVCRTVTETEPLLDENGRTVGEKEVTRTSFSMKIIEPCGKITELGGGKASSTTHD